MTRVATALLARTTVKKTLTGDLQGTSVAELLMLWAEDHAGYVASERVTGRLEGREGSFVLQHGGLVDGETLNPFGHVVPGSGTGDLAGLRGTGIFLHDENGATFTLDYWFVK